MNPLAGTFQDCLWFGPSDKRYIIAPHMMSHYVLRNNVTENYSSKMLRFAHMLFDMWTVPWLILPQEQIPDGEIPDWDFPEQTIPQRRHSQPDIFLLRHFLNQTFLWPYVLVRYLFKNLFHIRFCLLVLTFTKLW